MTDKPPTSKFNRCHLGKTPPHIITNWVVDNEEWIEKEVERINSLPGHKVKAVQHKDFERVWAIIRC